MGFINLTCKCGHTADLDEFCRTTIGGELPAGQFQCPACQVAWRRVESGHRLLRAGDETAIIATRVDIVLVESML